MTDKIRLSQFIFVLGLVTLVGVIFLNQRSIPIAVSVPSLIASPMTILPTLISTNPSNNAIDARDSSGRSNWKSVSLTFSTTLGSNWNLATDYRISTTNTTPINISSISGSVTQPDIIFSREIVPGERVTVTHQPTNSSVCLGFLPGDVTQDGRFSVSDISALRYWVSTSTPDGVAKPLWQTDINRDNVLDANDLDRLRDLRSAPNAILTLPACPAPILSPIEPIKPSPIARSTFRMAVESATQNGETITIITTGAQYLLTSTGMEMWRRIDPHTNTINPRKVATLTFDSNLGPLSIETSDNSKAVVQSSLATFEFMSDSLFFITAKSPFTYTQTNLIINTPWNKGTGRDRMWTDGYGGSLHAQVVGGTSTTNNPDSTTIGMATNDVMAHMVFPPKLFDYESFYGANARPFVEYVFDEEQVQTLINNISNYPREYGIIEVFGTLYVNNEQPTLVSPNIMGYAFRNETLIRQLVEIAHAHGFKVISYLSYPLGPEWNYPTGHPTKGGQHQDFRTTLAWMEDFQTEFNLDGWYFDNANAGDFLDDYNFIRQARTDIGDDGIIYHHNSVDVWGAWTGLRAVMVDAYVNYILAGETGRESPNLTARISDPDDPYLRFYSSGYGLSQAYGSHKRLSDMKLILSEGESARTVMENFVGMIDHGRYSSFWANNIKPPYEIKKAKYLAGTLLPDVEWPVRPDTGWFRPARKVRVTYPSDTSTTISWQTDEPATSEVAWSNNGVWWDTWQTYFPDGPAGRSIDGTLVTNHQVTINGLIAGTNYEFRIRSCSPSACIPNPDLEQEDLSGKTVWGFLFTKDANYDGRSDDAPPVSPPPEPPPSGGGNSGGGGSIIRVIAPPTIIQPALTPAARQALILQLKQLLLKLLQQLLALLQARAS